MFHLTFHVFYLAFHDSNPSCVKVQKFVNLKNDSKRLLGTLIGNQNPCLAELLFDFGHIECGKVKRISLCTTSCRMKLA